MRVWIVTMVVDIPVGRETTHTVEQITKAVEDKEKYRIFSHGKLLAKLLLYSHWEEVEIPKCRYGEDVTERPNNTHHPNDGEHPIPSILHCFWLATELCPVGDKLRPCAVDEGSARLRDKPITSIV